MEKVAVPLGATWGSIDSHIKMANFTAFKMHVYLKKQHFTEDWWIGDITMPRPSFIQSVRTYKVDFYTLKRTQ